MILPVFINANKVNKINQQISFKSKNININKTLSSDTVSFSSTSKNVSPSSTNSKQEIEEIFTNYKYDEGFGNWFVLTSNHPMDAYCDALMQLPYKVKRVLAFGLESLVLQLDNGKVLKLSTNDYREFDPAIDIPQFDRGNIKTKEAYSFKDKTVDNVYFLVQAKGRSPVYPFEVDKFMEDVLDPAGYEFFDIDESQLARYSEDREKPPRVVLIDTGAVRKKAD